MAVTVSLTLRASAIAIHPAELRWLCTRLTSMRVTRLERGASLDVFDCLVDLEGLGDRNAAVGAELVPHKARIRRWEGREK
jgi:hypothetical protein